MAGQHIPPRRRGQKRVAASSERHYPRPFPLRADTPATAPATAAPLWAAAPVTLRTRSRVEESIVFIGATGWGISKCRRTPRRSR